jgi:PAS domain S-box-containing protein
VYFFAEPKLSFEIIHTNDAISLVIYLLQSFIVIGVLHVLTMQERAIQSAREEETNAKRIAEKRLRDIEHSEKRFRQLIDSNIVGVISWDWDGHIFDANKAFLSMVGYNENELLNGKVTWKTLVPESDYKADALKVKNVGKEGMAQNTTRRTFLRKDGSRFEAFFTSSLSEDIDQGGIAFVIDVSEEALSLHKKK